jgi:hypothetical protein
MDSQQPDAPMGGADEEILDEGEEVEVTREELISALQEVITGLSTGLHGDERDAYLDADDLSQNDWFFAGISDQPGQFAVTMWPAEGDEDMLRIDIGGEDEVHALAADPDQVAALADDFIEGLSEEYDEEFEEDEEDEELDEEEDEELEEEDEYDADDFEEDDTVSQNGNLPPR